MAKRIMAGHPAPAPRGKSTTGTAPTITDGPSAADLLENRLEQLKSLLACCYGDDAPWAHGGHEKHRDNLIWIAADLASEAAELFQQCETERIARS